MNEIIEPMMDRKTDPFQRGTENDIKLSKWATKWAEKYFEDTGESSVHNRGLHYFMVMYIKETGERIKSPSDLTEWRYYENTDACVGFLNTALKYARYLKYLPFDCIDDDKNTVTQIINYYDNTPSVTNVNTLKTPGSIEKPYIHVPNVKMDFNTFDEYKNYLIDSYANGLIVSFDDDLTRPFYTEVWSEKTLPSYIHSIFEKERVGRVVEGGELSLRVMHDFITRLNKNKQDGVALFFSDFDTAGIEMPVNMAIKVMWAKVYKKLDEGLNAYIEHVAITPEQIEEHDLPLIPIKKQKKSKSYRKRTTKFKEKYGVEGGAELQVLSGQPDLFKEIVEKALLPWTTGYRHEVDEAINEMKKKAKADVKLEITRLLDQYDDDLRGYYSRFEDLQADIKNALPTDKEIKEMRIRFQCAIDIIDQNKSYYKYMALLDNIIGHIKLPDVEIPHVKKKPDHACMYDSQRNIGMQSKILRGLKTGKIRSN